MPSTTLKSAYLSGLSAAGPYLFIMVPFGLLFGVAATEAGLPVSQVMGFSVLVIAGAAQFTALQLMQDQAPTIVVLASALAVNLRMAMYSASLAAHLGKAAGWQRLLIAYFNVDATYALSHQEYETRPDRPLPDKVAFFAGTVTLICLPWYVLTWAGAVLGAAIPPEYGLDFAVPVAFISFVAPALRSLPHIVAALTSVVLSLALAWMPHNLWILAAGLGGMIAGAELDRRQALK